MLYDLKPDYYGVSPNDPSLENKQNDAKKAGVSIYFSPHYLKSYSSTKIGRMIRFEYLMSRSPVTYKKSQKDWNIFQNRSKKNL